MLSLRHNVIIKVSLSFSLMVSFRRIKAFFRCHLDESRLLADVIKMNQGILANVI